MTALTAAEIDAIAARHPAVFAGSLRKRLTAWLVGAGILAYLVFAWWFFAIGSVLANGNWGIAGVYLADWVSYEVRPNVEFEGDGPEDRLSARRLDRQGSQSGLDRGKSRRPTIRRSARRVVATFGGRDTVDIVAGPGHRDARRRNAGRRDPARTKA